MPTPIEMPDPLPVNAKAFDLNFQQDMTPVGGGFLQTVERVRPLWMAEYSTPPLSPARDQAFQAFLDSLEGSAGVFLGFDPRRPRPYQYRVGGGTPWGASPQVYSTSYALSQLAINGLTPGTVLTRGDYVSFQSDGAWHLHRITADGLVGGDGLIVVQVRPRPVAITGLVNARFQRPCAAMKIVGKPEKKDRVEDIGPSYTFRAVQYIERPA